MTWKDITIKKFYEITDILSVQDEYTMLNLIDTIYNVSSMDLNITDLHKYSIEFIKEPIPECEIPKNLVLNGRKYDVDFKLTDVKTAQFVDFQNYTKSGKYKYEDVLSVFITPEGKKYGDDYDLKQVKNDILSLSIVEAVAIAKFFFLQFKLFYGIFRLYLAKSLKEMELPKEEKQKVLEQLDKIDLDNLEYSLMS